MSNYYCVCIYLPSVGPVDNSCLVEDSLVSFTGSTLVLSSGIGSITTHTHTHSRGLYLAD